MQKETPPQVSGPRGNMRISPGSPLKCTHRAPQSDGSRQVSPGHAARAELGAGVASGQNPSSLQKPAPAVGGGCPGEERQADWAWTWLCSPGQRGLPLSLKSQET